TRACTSTNPKATRAFLARWRRARSPPWRATRTGRGTRRTSAARRRARRAWRSSLRRMARARSASRAARRRARSLLKGAEPVAQQRGAGVGGLLRVELGGHERPVLGRGHERLAVLGPGHHRLREPLARLQLPLAHRVRV